MTTTKPDFYRTLLDEFTGTLDSTLFVVERQTDGLTHADTLVQPPFRANCMNWVLGHIAVNRDRMLRLLGADPLLSTAETALYETGSEPITKATALPLDRLLALLRTSTARIKELVEGTSQDMMLAIVDEERQLTRLKRLSGLAWHETYHGGQCELLRQAAGKNDKVF